MRKSIVLLMLGTATLTYGFTRHLVVLYMIEKSSNYLREYHMEVCDSNIPVMYKDEISRGLSSVNEKIALANGPYEWLDGLILMTAIACSCFAASYYCFRRRIAESVAPRR